MKVKDVISLEKDFQPVFDLASKGEQDSGYWRRFITNKQFFRILDKVVTSVGSSIGKDRKSVWIEGGFGTGKSHSAAVIKHLLWDDINDVSNYIDRKIKEDPALSGKLKNLRKSKKFLPVVMKGADGTSNPKEISYEIQKAVNESLKVCGINDVTVETDFQTFIKLVEEGTIDFDKHIKDTQLSVYVANRDDILKKLKNRDCQFLNILRDTLLNKSISITTVDIKQWLSEVTNQLKGKDLADGIIIYWDEFTSVLDKNDPAIINQIQNIAELSNNKNIFLYLICHRMPSAINSDDARRIEDRFHKLQYSMEPVTTYHILNEAIKKENEDEFNRVRNEAYKDKALFDLARTLPGNDGSQSLEKLKSLFPIHPYTAHLLTYIARTFGSTNRSVFNFLNDGESGFLAHADDEFAPERMITADCLWDFFVKEFESDPSFSHVVVRYRQHEKSIKENSDTTLRVFKSILMLNALASTIHGSSDLEPLEENIKSIFAGTGVKIDDSLRHLSDRKIVERDPYGKYLIEVSSFSPKDIEEKKKRLGNEYGDPLSILKYNPPIGTDKIKEEIKDGPLRITEVEFFDNEAEFLLRSKIISKLHNKTTVNIAMFFAIGDNEKASLEQTLSQLSRTEEIKNKMLVFSEAILGESNRDKFLEYFAKFKLSASGKDQDIYRENLHKVIKNWVSEIKNANAVVYFNGERQVIPFPRIANEINVYYAPKIFCKGLDSLSSLTKKTKAVWKKQGSRKTLNAVLNANTRDTLVRDLGGRQFTPALSVFKDNGDNNYVINDDMSLKGGVNANHPIAALQKAVDDNLANLKGVSSFNLAEALNSIFEEPYGYYGSILGCATVAYAMRKYVDKLYSRRDQHKINALKMSELLESLLNETTRGARKNRDDFNVRFGSENEADLMSIFSKLFPTSNSENIHDTRWRIRDYCKKTEVNSPLWSLKYLDDVPDAVKSALTEVEKFAKNPSDSVDAKSINGMLETVKKYELDLERLITSENFKKGFDNFISKVLSSRNEACGDLDSLKSHIRRGLQGEVGLWEESQVENIILSWILNQREKRQPSQNPAIQQSNQNALVTVGADSGNLESAKRSIKEFEGNVDDLKNVLLTMLRDAPYISPLLNKYLRSKR